MVGKHVAQYSRYWVDCAELTVSHAQMDVTSCVRLRPSSNARSSVTTRSADWALKGATLDRSPLDTKGGWRLITCCHHAGRGAWAPAISDLKPISLRVPSALRLQSSWNWYYSHLIGQRWHPISLACAPQCRGLLDGGPRWCMLCSIKNDRLYPPLLSFSSSPFHHHHFIPFPHS